MKYFLKCFRNYANFKGRARRSEYWYFKLFLFLSILLFLFLISSVLKNVGFLSNLGSGELIVLVVLTLLGIAIPNLAVSVRRMHDVGKSGWFLLIPVYGFVLTFIEGNVGENEYGPDPKEEEF